MRLLITGLILLASSLCHSSGTDFLCEKDTLRIITTKEHPAVWGTSETSAFYHIKCIDIDISEALKFVPVYETESTTEYFFNAALISEANRDKIIEDGYIFFTSTGVYQCLRKL